MVRYGERSQGAEQADGDDDRETNVLTGYDAPHRNPPDKKESQEKGIVKIGGGESRQARG